MARKDLLRDRVTGDTLYPITAQECVLTRDGSGVATKMDVERGLADLVDSTPDYINTVDSLKRRLAENPDEALALAGEITEAKKKVFDDMWERASVYNGVRYGRKDKERDIYILNDVELTYEEAIYTYQRSAFLYAGGSVKSRYYSDRSIKTNFPIPFGAGTGRTEMASMSDLFLNCPNLEIAVVSTNYAAPYEIASAFYNCTKLREIRGEIQAVLANGPNFALNAFKGCVSLQKVKIQTGNFNLDFSDSPLLDFESFTLMVTNSRVTTNAVITVHPNVFAALEGEAEYPFNGGTQEEWEKLLEDALAKNISFATV